MAALAVDDVVTVVGEPGRYFQGCQGQVVKIFDDDNGEGKIGVKLGPEDSWRVNCRIKEEKVLRFPEEDLEKNEDWSLKNRAKLLFGERFHSIYYYGDPLDPSQLCMHENCQKN